MARETKTEAIRRALEERKARLASAGTKEAKLRQLRHYLEREVWPRIPADILGKPVTKEEREAILGIGPHGYPE